MRGRPDAFEAQHHKNNQLQNSTINLDQPVSKLNLSEFQLSKMLTFGGRKISCPTKRESNFFGKEFQILLENRLFKPWHHLALGSFDKSCARDMHLKQKHQNLHFHFQGYHPQTNLVNVEISNENANLFTSLEINVSKVMFFFF